MPTPSSSDVKAELLNRVQARSGLKADASGYELPGKPLPMRAAADLLTDEKRAILQKVRMLRQKYTNRMHVELPPHLVGKWIRNTPMNIMQYQMKEYHFPKPEDVKCMITPIDGRFIYGDVILMVVDRELSEAFDLYNAVLSVERVEGGKKFFSEFAEANKIRTVEVA